MSNAQNVDDILAALREALVREGQAQPVDGGRSPEAEAPPAQLTAPTPPLERHDISTQTPPCVMLSALDPWVIREQRRERGERLRYPSDETMDSLRTVLEGVVPHINAVLDACSQLPRVSLRAAELRPSAATGPRPSIQASTPRAVQPAAASLAHPAAERPPERRAQSPLEAERVHAPAKRPAPHGSAAVADPSPFEAARAKRVRVSGETRAAREVTRGTREERGRPSAPRNVRRRRMPQSSDFPPDWDYFARHFGLPPVDSARPCFSQRWQFVLGRAYRRRCLDAARKRGVTDPSPPDVRWTGNGRAPRQEPTMTQMWEVVHRLVAEEGLRLTPSRPADACRANPPAAPPEESPAVQSESDPRLRGEPLPDDDAPGPSCRPPRPAPIPPVAPASAHGPSTSTGPAPSAAAPPASAPDPSAVPAAEEPASAPRRMPAQLLRLPPSAYASSRGLSPRSKRAAEHLVRSYAGRSEAWWGTFIEVWDSFMAEVQRIGADPAAQLRSRHAKLMSGGQGCSVLRRGMRQEFLRAEGAAANFGQWAGEVLAELHAQEELAHAALDETWGRRWTALLVQRLSWDPLSAVDVSTPDAAGPSNYPAIRGTPPGAVEGEVLPGFPGAAVPQPPPAEPPAESAPGPARSAAEATAGDQPATPASEAMAAAEVPAADAEAEEAQPEPSLAGDVAGGASNSSDSGTEDEAGAGEVEEEEDLFASGSDAGADDAADDAAGQQEEDLFAFPDDGGPPPAAPGQ